VSPIVATFAASLVFSMILLTATSLLTAAALSDEVLATVLPTAVYDTVLAAVVGPLVIAVLMRRRDADRVDW
jgi:hypothetical protein